MRAFSYILFFKGLSLGFFFLGTTLVRAEYDYSLFLGPTLNFYHLAPDPQDSFFKIEHPSTNFAIGALIGTQSEGLKGELGVFYVTRGIQSHSPNGSLNLLHSFLEIPILFQFLVSYGYLAIGPYMGIPLSTSLSIQDLETSLSTGVSNPSIDFGMKGGLGFEIPVGSFLEFRFLGLYSFGVTNLGSGATSQSTRSLDLLFGLSTPIR